MSGFSSSLVRSSAALSSFVSGFGFVKESNTEPISSTLGPTPLSSDSDVANILGFFCENEDLNLYFVYGSNWTHLPYTDTHT